MIRALFALCLLALASSASAGRTLEITEHSVEASLSDVTLPSGPTGTVIVSRECTGCRSRTLLAGPDTRYFIRASLVAHTDFMQAVGAVRGAGAGESTLVGIYFDPDSERVTRIALLGNGDDD